MELKREIGSLFLVNGQRVKDYFVVDSDRDREAREINYKLSMLHHGKTLNQVLYGGRPVNSM